MAASGSGTPCRCSGWYAGGAECPSGGSGRCPKYLQGASPLTRYLPMQTLDNCQAAMDNDVHGSWTGCA